MAITGIKGNYVLQTGENQTTEYGAKRNRIKEVSSLKLLNFTAYNDLILAKEDTVCF